MKKIIIVLTFVMPFFAFSQNKLSDNIIEKLKRAKAQLTIPKKYTLTDIVENSQMQYDVAIVNKHKNCEIRYTIRPMDSLLLQKKNNPKTVMVDLNRVSKASLIAIAYNISDGHLISPSTDYDSIAVKNEYNADWASMILVAPSRQFAKNYKICLIVALHKDNIGDLYTFYMFNDPEEMQNILLKNAYNLKFE